MLVPPGIISQKRVTSLEGGYQLLEEPTAAIFLSEDRSSKLL
jgi:hypothetical protein